MGTSSFLPASKATTGVVSVTAPTGAALTAVLPAVERMRHYITRVEVVKVATANNNNAGLQVVTTSNLPGHLAWTTTEFLAKGSVQVVAQVNFDPPLVSMDAGQETTIMCPPPGPNAVWRVNVFYYLDS